MSRKTEFWRSTTPDKLGPGYYTSAASKIKPNKTAFLIQAKRPLSIPKHSVRFAPGPGQYSSPDHWLGGSSHQSSTFASKTKRNVFSPADSRSFATPGPGYYETMTISSNSSSKRPKYAALYLDPSPVSIPSGDPPTPAPLTESSPRESAKGTAFGKYKAERSVFKPKTTSPGPGTYYSSDNQPALQAVQNEWMFSSKSTRPATCTADYPGPGAYTGELSPARPHPKTGAFGLTPKDIPLSKDPHRPVLVGWQEVPAVGSYKNHDDLEKEKKLKAKFVTGEVHGKPAPFNSNEKRDLGSAAKTSKPGPGEYTAVDRKLKKSLTPFGSSLKRVSELCKPKDYPGPGAYDVESSAVDRASPMFTSKTPRFCGPLQRSPDSYMSHRHWNKKETRAYDAALLNQNICFDSTAKRFKETDRAKSENQEKIGPGSYYGTRPSTVATSALPRTERFKGFGNYRPSTGTDQNVGPGYYNPTASGKRSFNMVKELNSEAKLWI